MDLKYKLESICKNRMKVKSNNEIVRESLHLIGIFLLIAGLSLGFAMSLDVTSNELVLIMNWSKSQIVIVVTFIILLILLWGRSKMLIKNKVGTIQ